MMNCCGQQLSPSRTLVTSFTPRKPADDTFPFEEGDWVLCLASSSSRRDSAVTSPTISCALSNGKVQVYDQQTLHPFVSYRPGNSDNHIVTDLIYGPQDTLIAAGQDGSVVVTDLRKPDHAALQSTLHRTGNSQESALSVSLGYDSYLAAVASNKARVHFFDLRNPGTILGSYVDSHTDAVTQVTFHPGKPSVLLSSGEDGLVCCFDTTQPTEELALNAVMNIGAPCRRIGFCCADYSTVYCLTGSETASLWDINTATSIEEFGASRLRESLSSGKLQVDYLVDAHWDATRQELLLCAGNSLGDAALYTCHINQTPSYRWQASDLLVGGHRGVVRAWCPLATTSWAFSPLIITAGEDARLCEWNRLGKQANSIPFVSNAVGTSAGRQNYGKASAPYLYQRDRAGGPLRRERRHSKPSVGPY